MTAPQTKEVRGSNAEARIEGGLWVAIVAAIIAALALGQQHGSEKANDIKLAQQDKELTEQRQRILVLEQKLSDMTEQIKTAATDSALAKNTAQRMEARLNERRR